ncbi:MULTISPECIES: DUF2185 domain-containing protein [Mycobacteroides]|uniref:DUF2185 domain-containing protein n=1 Tax=Mycobacteroides TaxID=670516 RepID=UPI000940FB5B|nr:MULTISPECIES: DUF2185 domain-containing protein [Mycobacteroides]MBF9350686.1 DUF2185 domain-containing protein [Mycobacteroides chelonae]
MAEYMELIPKAGVCLATKNVTERRGLVRWMWRRPSQGVADNGWRVMSHLDTTEYLNDRTNWQMVSFNDLCNVEPALIGVYDFPVGADLQIVRDERGISIYDNTTGTQIPEENFYVPPQFRA